jgi:hypothetical protein
MPKLTAHLASSAAFKYGQQGQWSIYKKYTIFLKNGKIYHDSKKLHFYTVTSTDIGDQALATNCVRGKDMYVHWTTLRGFFVNLVFVKNTCCQPVL